MTSLHLDRDGPVWTIRLDRPHVRNSLDPATAEALALAWREIDADPDVRAVSALTREIGTAAAADLLLTGRHFDAAEAAALGILGRVCAPEDLAADARATAAVIAGNAPLTVAAIKRTYTAEHRRAFAAERAAALTVLATGDAREGAQAFLQRRPPHFLGR